MEFDEARAAAGLSAKTSIRHQALSALFDVLVSPSAAAAIGPILAPFRCADGRGRIVLAAETVPVLALLDLSTPMRERFVVFAAGELVLEATQLGQAIDQFSWQLNGLVAVTARDFFLLHAGCVTVPDADEAIVIPAESGSGKSSLTAALVEAGFGYLSDEFAPIDPVSGLVHPYPKPINLKVGSRGLFPSLDRVNAPGDDHWHVTAEELGGSTIAEPRPVRYVVLPTWAPGSTATVSALTGAQTVLALCEHALGMPFYGSRAVDLMARLCPDMTSRRITYRSSREAVELVLGLVTG